MATDYTQPIPIPVLPPATPGAAQYSALVPKRVG